MSFSVRVSVVLALFVLKTSETNAFKQSPLLVKDTAILDDVLAVQHQNLQENQTSYGSSSSEMPPTDYKRVTAGDLGTARGTILKSFMGRDFYAFMSIPYAQPPVGDLRFRNPEPWEGPWPQEVDGDYEATWLRAKCPQISLILDVISGREDCLHLSIYTPLLPEDMEANINLPVMFWIHGGAYTTGDASLYVPTKLMDRDVVVVVVQYRLASLGFLAGGIPEAPGNMGLLDQIMALRWVQDYISYFGGDPNLVTVFGQSAGGASASWLQLTPLTNETTPQNNGRQLLHRVIVESGSALEIWTIDNNPHESFQDTAALLNCSLDGWSSEEKVECMKTRSYQEVTRASLVLYAQDRITGGLGFRGLCPVIQSELANGNHSDLEIVIPKDPRATLELGEFLKVPVMIGSVRDEGSLIIGLAYKDYLYPNNHTPNDTDFMRDQALHMIISAFGIDDKNGAITDTMQVAYLPYATMGDWDTMVGGMIDMGGVMFLKAGLWELVHYVNRVAPDEVPVYFYSWEFEADDSLFPWIFLSMPDIPVPGGISHADELLYLFHLPSDLDDRQKVMVERMLTLWTNFAICGNPTPDDGECQSEEWKEEIEKWQTFSLTQPNFMLITDTFTVAQDFLTRWNYHRDVVGPTTQAVSSTAEPQVVSKEEFDQQVHKTKQWQLATGILTGLVACTVIVAAALLGTLYRKNNQLA